MLTDILEINQTGLAEMYDFNIQTNNNIIIFGPAGIGKTVMSFQAAKRNDVEYMYLNLSVLESADLIGLPQIKDKRTSYATPEFLPGKNDKVKPIVLILDEIDKAAPELQNPCLELFQFRSINGIPLNIKAIICTANMPDEGAFSKKISHALTNRCSIFKIKIDFNSWRKWAVENKLNPLIISFLQTRQDLLLNKNESGDPTAYCNPSPRAWTLASKDLDALDFEEFSNKIKKNEKSLDDSDKSNDDEISTKYINNQFRLIAGRVGVSAALELKTWLVYYKELDPFIDQILNEGKLDQELTSDRQIICATAVISKMKVKFLYMEMKDKLELAENVFGWMAETMPPSFILASIKSTINNKYAEANNLLDCDNFQLMLNQIQELSL